MNGWFECARVKGCELIVQSSEKFRELYECIIEMCKWYQLFYSFDVVGSLLHTFDMCSFTVYFLVIKPV